MKIVDRKNFLQMPVGTVFCKFPLAFEGDGKHILFGISTPKILVSSNAVDFWSKAIGGNMYPSQGSNSEQDADILFDMQRNPGKEVPFEHCSVRDGLYEDDNVGFAIFSRDEVKEIISILENALAAAY